MGTYIAERRRALGLNQDDLAEAVGVTRTIVSAWENERRRPRADHLEALARVLDDGGELATLARYDDGEQPPLFETPVPVGDLCRRVAESLITYLSVDMTSGTEPGYGWRHNIDEATKPPSALATAYGLRAVTLGGSRDWRVKLAQVRETLRRLELPEGGWTARNLSPLARPEVTAVVVAALSEAGEDAEFVADRVALVLEALDRRAPDAEPARPYVLTTSLIELSRLDCDERAGRRLVEGLVDLSRIEDSARAWPVVVKSSSLPGLPSTVHTSAAICAIAAWAERLDDPRLAEVARSGMIWLEHHSNLDLEDEDVRSERSDGGYELLHVRHFTPAWVVQAARAVGVDPGSGLVNRALRSVLSYYLPDAALWHWPRSGGMFPIWMSYHGVAALTAWAGSHEIS